MKPPSPARFDQEEKLIKSDLNHINWKRKKNASYSDAALLVAVSHELTVKCVFISVSESPEEKTKVW